MSSNITSPNIFASAASIGVWYPSTYLVTQTHCREKGYWSLSSVVSTRMEASVQLPDTIPIFCTQSPRCRY